MVIEEFDLPVYWASALINGDSSGMDDGDEKSLHLFTDWMVGEYGQCWCLSVEGHDYDGDFRKYHDAEAFGVLPCNVATYSFDVTKR